MFITKSNYTQAKRCSKALWLSKKNPELAEISESTEERFRSGNIVGEYARKLIANGILVEFDKEISKMLLKTKELLSSGQSVIYEAAFMVDNLLVICDLLKVTENGFEIVEVKSSTEVKDTYIDDISYQYYVVKKCGHKISKSSIAHINKNYVKHGEIDCQKLFTVIEVTDKCINNYEDVEKNVSLIKKMLSSGIPNKSIDTHCSIPYDCEFRTHCFADLPDYSVFNLYRVGNKAFQYYNKKIYTLEDLQNSGEIITNHIQKLQIDAKINDKEIIIKDEISKFLNSITYPLYFLDFETFQEAVPTIDGTCPFSQIPFQYSLHYIENENGELLHKEFLGEMGEDLKYNLSKQLCEDIGENGTVIVYNKAFESTVLSKLAVEFSDLANKLLAIRKNLVDLLIPFRSGHYYNKAMKGSFSIKSVLPALFPDDDELNYKKLEISNGQEAMTMFPKLHNMSMEDLERARKDLLAYCKLDTLAMVKLLNKLKQV